MHRKHMLPKPDLRNFRAAVAQSAPAAVALHIAASLSYLHVEVRQMQLIKPTVGAKNTN